MKVRIDCPECYGAGCRVEYPTVYPDSTCPECKGCGYRYVAPEIAEYVRIREHGKAMRSTVDNCAARPDLFTVRQMQRIAERHGHQGELPISGDHIARHRA